MGFVVYPSLAIIKILISMRNIGNYSAQNPKPLDKTKHHLNCFGLHIRPDPEREAEHQTSCP